MNVRKQCSTFALKKCPSLLFHGTRRYKPTCQDNHQAKAMSTLSQGA